METLFNTIQFFPLWPFVSILGLPGQNTANWYLRTIEIDCLPETRSLKSRYWQDWYRLSCWRENIVYVPLLASVASAHRLFSWPMAATLPSLPPSSISTERLPVCVSLSLCVQMSLFCMDTGIWIRHWRRKWQPTPVLLPGKSHRHRSMVGYSLWGCKELDTTEQLLSLPSLTTTSP